MKFRFLMTTVVMAAVFFTTGILHAANGDLIVNGNLGVGTPTPAGKAEINGNMIVDGKLGVGTPTPTEKAEINGNLVVNGGLNVGTAGIKFSDGSTQSISCKMNVVSTEFTNKFSTASTGFVDVTGFSATITPSTAGSKILVMANVNAGMNSATAGGYRILRGTSPIAVPPAVTGYTSVSSASFYSGSGDANNNEESSVIFLDAPATTSPVTYKIQVYAPQGSTLVVNGLGSDAAGQSWSMRTRSSLTLMEIK